MILTLCIEAFTPYIEDVLISYRLPLPTQFPDLQLQIEDLVCLVLVSWDRIVRTSYPIALVNCQLNPKWGVPTLHDFFIGALHVEDHSYLLDVFSGTPPYTDNPLKKLAAAGAYLFDHSQVAVLLKIQTTTKQTLVAANNAFCEIYDSILQHLPDDSPLADKSDYCLQRH